MQLKININKIVCLSFLIFSASCGKEKADPMQPLPNWLPGPMTFGTVTGIRDEDNWIASGEGHYGKPSSEYFYFQGGTFDASGASRENLFIQPIPLALGKYPVRHKTDPYQLDGFSNASFALEDDDVLESYYITDDSILSNYVEVLEYDSITHIVKGVFDIHFTLALPDINTDVPKKIHFSNGYFEVQLREY